MEGVELPRLWLTVALLAVVAFVFAAGVMWRLRSTARDQQPLWLILGRQLMLTIMAALVFFGPEVRGGVIELTREVWIGLGIVAVGASVLALVLELRQRRSGGGETA